MDYIRQTKNWLEKFVIGLKLCPFAEHPFRNGQIRYLVYEGNNLADFVSLLEKELHKMVNTPSSQLETTLLLHPHLLTDFFAYNDFLAIADQLLVALKLEGIIQIASFHPAYQFAGTQEEDVTNYTNRSPYPMLHLLREDSIEKAVNNYKHPEAIPERNMEVMQTLGKEKIKQLLENN